MRLAVMPMSSGEYEVQVEMSEYRVKNYQVPEPRRILDAMPDAEAHDVVRESFALLLADRTPAELRSYVSLDELWVHDSGFAHALRARLG